MKHHLSIPPLRRILRGAYKSWVLFEHGTVAVLLPPVTDLRAAALEVLREAGPVVAGSPAGDFSVQVFGNDGWIVNYDHPDLLTHVPRDGSEGEGSPRTDLEAGLHGRSCRAADAKKPRIVHVEDRQGPGPLRLEDLSRLAAEGQRLDYVFFWRPRLEPHGRPGPGCLGQWWQERFEVDGISYATAEHYMMAMKARLFGDQDALQQILASSDPAQARSLGRRVQGFQEEAWDRLRFAVVVEGNLAKFRQLPDLGDYLLSTGDAVLAEASPMDRIWGIGIEETHPDARDPHRWRGSNLLGFALMQVRHLLRSGAS